jgi:hypothetical protein
MISLTLSYPAWCHTPLEFAAESSCDAASAINAFFGEAVQ